MFVLYGIITEQSVARLLIAGIVPGIVCAMIYMALIYVRVKINPKLAPPVEKVPLREAVISLKNTWGVAILAPLLLGGIYFGVFTPTEAAGVGAFAALALGLIARRFLKADLSLAFLDTAKSTAMIYLILAGAYIFGYLLAISHLPFRLSDFLSSLTVSRYVILAAVMIFYIILGCFIDMVPAMFITLPMIYPTIVKLGFDPIWFGVLIVQLGEISLLTPPFGLNLFIIKSIMPEVEMHEIIQGVFPFIGGAILVLFTYIVFPELSLFLPNMMFGK
jgi:tripartite ATP-independent transporter DctM subunit